MALQRICDRCWEPLKGQPYWAVSSMIYTEDPATGRSVGQASPINLELCRKCLEAPLKDILSAASS